MKKPKIRFKGFTETWEQRKFNNLFVERRDKTKEENEDTLLSSAIDGMYLNSELFSHFRGSSTIGYLKVKKNDLILSAQNLHLGNANVNLRFESGIISPAYKVFNLIDCEPNYVQAWVKKDSTKNFFLSCTTEGASVCRKNIDWNALKNNLLFLPNLDEQKKIGTFFSKLDHLITLHQRKCENLKKLKKFMLQKLFPQNGENVPKVRFLNFTDTWEQRKLFDFTYFYNGLTYTPDDVRENGTLVLRSSNVKHSEIVLNDNVYVDPIKVNSEYVKKGDIIIVVRNGSRALIGKHAVIKDEMPNTVIGAFMSGIRSQYSFFVNSLLDTSQFKEEILRNLGATINQITGYMFSKMEFMIPSCYEQKIIGDYFSKLDNLITLHQSKCDNLKELKKYMLKNMFI